MKLKKLQIKGNSGQQCKGSCGNKIKQKEKKNES